MSFDTILMLAAVLSVFAVFAAVLIWADFQTRSTRSREQGTPHKHRGF